MKRFLMLIALVGILPLAGYFAGVYVEADYDKQWLELVKKEIGPEAIAIVKTGQLSLKQFCENPKVSKEDACRTYQNVQLLKIVSVYTLIVGLTLLLLIYIAARLASSNRTLLLHLFSPGINAVLFTLFGLIIVQGAIATYGAYIFEVTATHRVHYFLIGGIGIGALLGAFAMINAGLSISQRVSISVIGKAVTVEEQPHLWEFVKAIAGKLNASVPKNIVLGLEPNFYATSAEVTVYPEGLKKNDETLYLSLPLMRIFSKQELAAVIGHELGHFRGEDTKFSLRFYPIYVGTSQALAVLDKHGDKGSRSLALLPAIAILSFFMEQFAQAERSIGRTRELEADKAGALVSSTKAIATSLLKVSSFASLWDSVRSSMIDALNQGKAYRNVSVIYAEIAASYAKPELVDNIKEIAISHPTDTHPPTSFRIQELGIPIQELRDEAFVIDLDKNSATLIIDAVIIEEYLTDIEHRVLIESGRVNLPDDIAQQREALKSKETQLQHPEEDHSVGDSYICSNCGKVIKKKDLANNMELFCPECNGLLNDA